MEQTQGPNKALVGIIIVVLLAAVGGAIFYLSKPNNNQNQTETSSNKEVPPSIDNEVSITDEYKDGTYTAAGTYNSPGGQEEIELTITLSQGVITGTKAGTKAASGTSKQYQQEFIGGYKKLVIGKNIDEVELDRVAGSSLTSNGFNNALDEIRQKAAA